MRSPTGSCIEESNCNAERVTLCAFDGCSDTQCKVDFLSCMDKAQHGGEPVSQAKTCYKGDFSSVQSCYAGSKGDQLLQTAANIWNKAYPGRATVPCVQVNGVKVQQADEGSIKAAICSAGSRSSAC